MTEQESPGNEGEQASVHPGESQRQAGTAGYGQPGQSESGPGQPPPGQPAYPQPPQGQPAYGQPPQGQPAYGQPPQGQPGQLQQPYGAPGYGQVQPYSGQLGKVRSTGVSILLFIVTLGIYGLVWYYLTHDEMKRHSGEGLGGALALVLAFFVGIVMPFLTSSEVGKLYERRGQQPPVSALTGLWYFPGAIILIGPIVWFVKTNGALNDYWRSLGAVG
jgi:hypothetical protein